MALTEEIDQLLRDLFPLHRSLTGEGNRETLHRLQKVIPLKVVSYPSGRKVYDWTIPPQWRVKEAWIKNQQGDKIIDLASSNLHVASYSVPVRGRFSRQELLEHLCISADDLPDAIPYRTTYYDRNWYFCVSKNDYNRLFVDDEYEVLVDSELSAGNMEIGELVIPGKTAQEFLVSTYICHPSLANDNLSGVILSAFLSRWLLSRDNRLTYRFIFAPETIGALAYLAHNEAQMKIIDAGLVVTTVGGPGPIGYKQSFDPAHPLNLIIEEVLREQAGEFKVYPFEPFGSDERQYSSPGFRINMASITKDKYHEYAYYHTSKDDLDFVKAEHIGTCLEAYQEVIERFDNDVPLFRPQPHGEIMLSARGLYPGLGGQPSLPQQDQQLFRRALLWTLFCGDGRHGARAVALKARIPLVLIEQAVKVLMENGLISKEPQQDSATVRDFCERYDDSYFQKRHGNDPKRLQSFQQEKVFINRFISEGSVCDVGCSTGEFLNAIDWKGERYGMEINVLAAQEARSHGIRFDKNILNQREFFDMVVYRGTIQHLPTPFSYIERSFHALKKGGYIVFLATPNANSIYYKLFNTLPLLAPSLNFFIPSDIVLSNALKNFGFETCAVEYPYRMSPYADLWSDHFKFIKKLLLRTDDRFAFWRSSMNLIARKV